MLATYIEPRKTPLTIDEARECLLWAFSPSKDSPITNASLALVMAQASLETGRFESIYNFNFGNIKAGEQHVGMFTCFPCNEVLNGTVHWFEPSGETRGKGGPKFGVSYEVPPGHPQTRFRAYPNRYDGALDYARTLEQRFPIAYAQIPNADPTAFVSALKFERFFTAPLDRYLIGVMRLRAEYLHELETKPIAFPEKTP